jgi:WD40 repeat protein
MPSLFGEVQIWRVDSDEAKHEQVRSIKVGTDSIFGLSWSPDGERIAVGCSDRTARVLQVKDGKELLKFDNHSDWVFGTAFTLDGKRLVTASRDKSMKLIDAVSGQLVDEINRESEPLLCMARFPSTNLVICGTDQGASRIFKIAERADRAGGGDPNFVKEVERLPGPVHAVACSADGTLVAVGGAGSEVKVFNARDGKKLVTLKGQEGSIYAVAFNSQTNQIATGGFDGKLRIYELSKGNLLQTCDPVPLRVAKAH